MAGNQGGDAWFKTAMPLRAWELHWAMPGVGGWAMGDDEQ